MKVKHPNLVLFGLCFMAMSLITMRYPKPSVLETFVATGAFAFTYLFMPIKIGLLVFSISKILIKKVIHVVTKRKLEHES